MASGEHKDDSGYKNSIQPHGCAVIGPCAKRTTDWAEDTMEVPSTEYTDAERFGSARWTPSLKAPDSGGGDSGNPRAR
jgi:hypothetical protein